MENKNKQKQQRLIKESLINFINSNCIIWNYILTQQS